MASNAQIEANRCNSQSSTGPRTESGKATSSRNRLTHGLYTREDHVEPGEEEIYTGFCQTLYDQLTPVNLLEKTFAEEIVGASWRLRQCALAEADLEGFDEPVDRTRRGIERARAAAHNVIGRSLRQLGKLQTERIVREKLDYGGTNDTIAADCLKLVAAQKADEKARRQASQQVSNTIIQNLEKLASNCNAGDLVAGLASNCKSGNAAKAACVQAPIEPPATPQIARNAQCPCRSGEKYKRCCGKNAPPVLGKAA